MGRDKAQSFPGAEAVMEKGPAPFVDHITVLSVEQTQGEPHPHPITLTALSITEPGSRGNDQLCLLAY
jgi:hypothetical protein